MSEIIINHSIVDGIIRNYSKENSSFVIVNTIAKESTIDYKFFLEAKECRMVVYYKKNNVVKMVAIGNNVLYTKKLIDYVSTFGSSAKINTQQLVVNISQDQSEKMLNDVAHEFTDFISINKNNNITKLNAVNGEILTISQYEKKTMIQGKPLVIFGIIVTYLIENFDIKIEDIISASNSMNYSTKLLNPREELKYLLKTALDYIDESLIKSLSSSLYMLKIFSDKKAKLEDYSGCLTGAFKCVEGYLRQNLIKFGYKLNNSKSKISFYMFNVRDGQTIIEEGNKNISFKNKKHLVNLYKIYKNKRNVYLHGNSMQDQTAIITNYEDAKSIFDEIIELISSSYKDFMEV